MLRSYKLLNFLPRKNILVRSHYLQDGIVHLILEFNMDKRVKDFTLEAWDYSIKFCLFFFNFRWQFTLLNTCDGYCDYCHALAQGQISMLSYT